MMSDVQSESMYRVAVCESSGPPRESVESRQTAAAAAAAVSAGRRRAAVFVTARAAERR